LLPVATVEGCNSVETCNSELKRFVPDLLKVWGNNVDCCDNQKTSVALDPKNFGFDTAQELASAINALLNPPLELDFIDGIGTSVQPTTAGVWEILVLPGAPANKVIQVFLDNSAFSGVPMGIRKVGSNVATQFDVEKHNFRNVKTNENGAIEVFATLIAGNNVFAYAGHFEL
jgi:hypothetical protein